MRSWPKGRRIGRGRSEAQELCRITTEDLTRLGTPLCETGAADPNAPSGASTAAPYFGARRSLQLVAFCSLKILNRNSGASGAIWCLLVLSGTIWACLWLSGAIWSNVRLTSTIWCYLDLCCHLVPSGAGASEPICGYLVLSGVVWG